MYISRAVLGSLKLCKSPVPTRSLPSANGVPECGTLVAVDELLGTPLLAEAHSARQGHC